MSAAAQSASVKAPRKKLSKGAKRGIWAGIIVVVLLGMGLGTKFVPDGDPVLSGGTQAFDAATYGADNFPKVQADLADQAVNADTLAAAIAEDPAAAAKKYAVQSSGGPVYSTKFTGTVGEGQSGIYEVKVEGLPEGLLVRIQTGPAINGTDLRDATGKIEFGQFTNQIDFQNAAASLNDELKKEVLSKVDAANLTGKTVTVTGAFTLVNPAGWLVTPSDLEVQ